MRATTTESAPSMTEPASMTHVFDGADDPQMEEWRRSIARSAAEGGTRD